MHNHATWVAVPALAVTSIQFEWSAAYPSSALLLHSLPVFFSSSSHLLAFRQGSSFVKAVNNKPEFPQLSPYDEFQRICTEVMSANLIEHCNPWSQETVCCSRSRSQVSLTLTLTDLDWKFTRVCSQRNRIHTRMTGWQRCQKSSPLSSIPQLASDAKRGLKS